MSGRDVIAEMNAQAVYNHLTQDQQVADQRFTHEYEPVRIPMEKQELIREEFRTINRIAEPTLSKLDLVQNRLDLQDRIFNRAQHHTNNANTCIQDARNVSEVNQCCDRYLQVLRTDFRSDVLRILREY